MDQKRNRSDSSDRAIIENPHMDAKQAKNNVSDIWHHEKTPISTAS